MPIKLQPLNFFDTEKRNAYKQLMRLDKPVGTYLLLWPTLWALWLAAGGLPELSILAVFSLGVFLMRSAGCVINDFADRKLDGHVERTKNRPLAIGIISAGEALSLFCLLVFSAFLLVLWLNWQTIALSLVALFLASLYPFMKRFTYLPQFVLGAAFSWAIPMAFMAVTGEIPGYAWLLYLLNLLWTVAYDTLYAIVDRDDDVKIGIKSTAILFGRYDRLIIALLQLSVLVLAIVIGQITGLGYLYNFGLLLIALLFIRQQYQVRHYDKAACFSAFLANNYVGMSLFIAIAADLAFNLS